ncbi:hypothetical protein TA3x_004069 [Tundrisphaera sp. TA3]|uniref:hypothetical protein n=1 Tax=Tundrisphaera sp. TA3 TaxID=3435775 RepID=UPI003EBCD842
MPHPHAEPARPRDDRLLTRSLAAILFPFGLITLLAAPVAVAAAIRHRSWGEAGGAAAALIAGWTLAWLSCSLWTGRGVPPWFIRAFFAALFAIPMIGALTAGTWEEVALVTALLMPIGLGSVLYNTPASNPPTMSDRSP